MRWHPKAVVLIGAMLGPAAAASQAERAAEADAQLGGPFQVLTQTFFPTTDHHLTDRLSFAGLYDYKRRLSTETGIDFALLSAPVFQVGTGADTRYLDNELDLLFSWRLIETAQTTGRIFFYGIWVETFSDLATGAFGKSQGVFTLPNSGGTDPDKRFVSPSALWWEQNFADSGLRYRVGQLWSTNLWATNEFYGDDRATYMNSLMGGGAGVPWISGNRGLGAMVSVERPGGYLSFGFQDSKADQQTIDIDSFSDGRFSYLAEIGLHARAGDRRTGTYKLTLGYVDANGESGARALPAGYGVNLSGQQELNTRYAVYGFYRRSWERFAANVEQSAAFGVTALQPFGWRDDNASIAAFYAQPADTEGGSLRDEWGFETFWRVQLTPRVDITPSAVVFLRPGRVVQDNPVVVFGLRLRFIL